MIVTGGVAPNEFGGMDEHTSVLMNEDQAEAYRQVTDAVHAEDGRICMQVLHTGRYADLTETIGAWAIPTRINKSEPRAHTADEVEITIEDFVRCAARAQHAGFDGLEIVGFEGYLITQFCTLRTNDRDDEWGGTFDSGIKFRSKLYGGRVSASAPISLSFTASPPSIWSRMGLHGTKR